MAQFINDMNDNFLDFLSAQLFILCLIPIIVGGLEIAGVAEHGAQFAAMLIDIILMLVFDCIAAIIGIVIEFMKD